MINIKFQPALDILFNKSIDDFPRTLMLIGQEGCGKHTFINNVAEKYKLDLINITDNIDKEYLDNLRFQVRPSIYYIDSNLSIKEQNELLKFIEEPLKNSFIVLIAETDNGILQTILNRCQIWYLQNYKREYLKTFLESDNEFILEIAQTPGQVKELNSCSFDGMIELADKIIDKIQIAGISNTLTLSGKVGFKNERGTFDGKLFVEILISRLRHRWLTVNDVRYVAAYNLTNELKKNINIKNLDYKALFERYLIQLREIMKGA